MSRFMFVFLTGSEKGKTRIFAQDRIRIGTSDGCDLKIVPEEGGVLPEAVLAEVCGNGNGMNLIPLNGNKVDITVNGAPVLGDQTESGHPIQDGDTIHFGQGLSSASLLFHVMPETFSTGPLALRETSEMGAAAERPVHPLTATLFVKELTASLWAEIPRRAKYLAIAAVTLILFLIVGLMGFGLFTLIRNANKTERLSQQIDSIQARAAQDQEYIKKQQEEIERLRETNEQKQRFTQKIAELYSPGVCLIVGTYSFVERGSGRPLRYESADAAFDIPVDQNGNLQASPEGAGPVVRFEYTGTGFVIEKGVIATNKHVVQAWTSDRIAQLIMQSGNGFQPRVDTLEAFFPSIQSPFPLAVAATSSRYDVALCKFDQGEAAIPIIPLSNEDPKSSIGEPVVLLGYPTGVDGLLQRIEENEKGEILNLHGQSVVDVATGLAERGLVRPLTTTGTISDALPGKIVHSAQTTEGGSGSPMFDRDGRVMAINSAVLATIDGNQSFGGSNFGVPVKAVADLLPQYLKSAKNE
jgi:S1-C subfamily serine protease